MKRKLLYLIAILPLFLFFSCGNDDSEMPNEDLLVGKWELVQIYAPDVDEDIAPTYPPKESAVTDYCKIYITKLTDFKYEFIYNYGMLKVLADTYRGTSEFTTDGELYAYINSRDWTLDDYEWNAVKFTYLVDGDKLQVLDFLNEGMFGAIVFAYKASIVKLTKDEFIFKEPVVDVALEDTMMVYNKFRRIN